MPSMPKRKGAALKKKGSRKSVEERFPRPKATALKKAADAAKAKSRKK